MQYDGFSRYGGAFLRDLASLEQKITLVLGTVVHKHSPTNRTERDDFLVVLAEKILRSATLHKTH